MTPTLKTPYQKEKEARELAIYNEYQKLIAEPGAQATAVNDFIMKKYGIHAPSTLYTIRKRVEMRKRREGMQS